MMRIFALLILFAISSPAAAKFNCDNLIGAWTGDRFDKTLSSDRRVINTMSEDGNFWIKFIYNDGNSITEYIQYGNWFCDGETLHVEIKAFEGGPVAHRYAYRLIEVRPSYHSFADDNPPCQGMHGDCYPGSSWEYFRISI
jgi:hypothetical protein